MAPVMGRPSAANLAACLARAEERNRDLRDEVRALRAERDRLALNLRWIARIVMRSVILQRDDLATEGSHHLDYLATRLERQAAA